MNEDRSDLELRSRAAFDRSVESLDSATRGRLARARAKAIAQLERPRLSRPAIWVPAAAASVLVIALVWRMDGREKPRTDVAQIPIEELQLIPAEDFEMLQEEEGFYAWAAEQMSEGVG